MDVNEGTINAAMNCVAAMAIEEIAEVDNMTIEESAVRFLSSNTAQMLFDDQYKLWWDGPSAIADSFFQERECR